MIETKTKVINSYDSNSIYTSEKENGDQGIFITYSLFTDLVNEQRKKVYIDFKNQYCKESAINFAYQGEVKKKRIPFYSLLTEIEELHKKSCLMSGVYSGTGNYLMSYDKSQTDKRYNVDGVDYSVIQRTKEHFNFLAEEILACIDIDFPSCEKLGYMHGNNIIPRTIEEVEKLIKESIPEMKNVPMIIKPSSTGFLYREDGTEISGPRYHVYFPVKSKADFDYFREVVFKKLFIADLGWIQISKNGGLMERTFIDQSLYKNPTQQIYAHSALIDNDKSSAKIIRKAPKMKYFDGDSYYTKDKILSEDEVNYYHEKVRTYKEKAEPKRFEIETKYCETKLKEEGLTCTCENIEIKRTEIARKRDTKVLHNSDIVFTKEFGNVTVKQIIEGKGKFHNCSCLDPNDFSDSKEYKAKIYMNDDGVIRINSFVNGNHWYRFKHYDKLTKLKDENPSAFHENKFIGKIEAGEILHDNIWSFFIDNHQRKAITATPGFGKTRETLKAIIDLCVYAYMNNRTHEFFENIKVDYFVPTHELAQDVFETWNELVGAKIDCLMETEFEGPEMFEVTTYNPKVEEELRSLLKGVCIRGRHAEVDGETLCKHQLKSHWDKSIHGVIDSSFCKGFKDIKQNSSFENILIKECTHKSECEYLKQRTTEENKNALIHFLPHDYLTNQIFNDERIQDVNFIIIDEDPIQGKFVNSDNIFEISPGNGWDSLDRITRYCESGGDVFDIIDSLREILEAERKIALDSAKACLGNFTKGTMKGNNVQSYKQERAKLNKELTILDIVLGFKKGNKNIWTETTAKGQTMLYLGVRKEIISGYTNKKILFLDGTGSSLIIKAAFGENTKIIEIKVKASDKCKNILDYRERYSKTALLGKAITDYKGTILKDSKGNIRYEGSKKMDEVIARIKKMKNNMDNLCLISWKDVIVFLKKKIQWLTDDHCMSFVSNRGLNHAEKKNHVIVIGNYLINERAALRMARLLFYDQKDLDFSKGPQKKLFKLKDGTVKSVLDSHIFEDVRIKGWIDHCNTSEMDQSYGRARYIHTDDEKLIEGWNQASVNMLFDTIIETDPNGLNSAFDEHNILPYWDDKLLCEVSNTSIRMVREYKDRESDIFEIQEIETYNILKNKKKGKLYAHKKNNCRKFLIKVGATDEQIIEGLTKITKHGLIKA